MHRLFTSIAVFSVVAVVTAAPKPAFANDETNPFDGPQHSPHIFEVFLGWTHGDHDGHDEQAFSIGAQYRYAINHKVSFGVLAEYSESPFESWILGVPFVFNLGETSWQLTTMPGIELEGSEQEFLFRTGIGYEFETESGFSYKPEINVDWVDGETAVVVGVSFGRRF